MTILSCLWLAATPVAGEAAAPTPSQSAVQVDATDDSSVKKVGNLSTRDLIDTATAVSPRTGAASVGKRWGEVTGILQFRGNPTHTWYGEGPLPRSPEVLWRFPRRRKMCAVSKTGGRDKQWCGTGWTGQPVVWERPDGVTEVIFGAFDRRVHFLDADTGRRTRPDFRTGDIIKGSVTLDPNGYPLIYFGSRDNRLRIVALDRKRPRQLWALHSRDYPGLYDNDWDGNPSIIDDVMFAGGENGYFFAVKLHRGYDADGQVTVAPEVLVAIEGWTRELIEEVGDQITSIESSVAIFEDRAYFANGLGRVVGLDIARVHEGVAPVVFDFWAGDDIDASIVVDTAGMLYVAAELERFLPRAREIGQLFKLDPTRPDDPIVWGIPIPAAVGDAKGGGIWSTPALGDGVLYVTTESGRLMVVDSQTGEIAWEERLTRHLWASPVVVDDELLVATCEGELRAYSVAEPRTPRLQWSLRVGGRRCIESTPAVWRGRIFVGTWSGYFFAVGDATLATTVGARAPAVRVR